MLALGKSTMRRIGCRCKNSLLPGGCRSLQTPAVRLNAILQWSVGASMDQWNMHGLFEISLHRRHRQFNGDELVF
jgi:hypothetical protein